MMMDAEWGPGVHHVPVNATDGVAIGLGTPNRFSLSIHFAPHGGSPKDLLKIFFSAVAFIIKIMSRVIFSM